MLTDIKMWNIIKKRFGIPYTFFELDADETIQYIKEYTLPFFSSYIPTKKFILVNGSNLITDSEYEIPYDGDIISIVDIYQDVPQVITGTPITPIAPGDITPIVTSIMQSNLRWKFSTSLNFSWEFIPPKTLRVSPPASLLSESYLILECEVVHESFETIPARFERIFTDAAIADIMDVLGSIRTKYQDFQTPFGTIQLNGDALKSEAEQIRGRILETLNTLPPNVHVVVS